VSTPSPIDPLKAILFMEKQSFICAEAFELLKQMLQAYHKQHPSSCHWLECPRWPCQKAAELLNRSWKNSEEAA
jgi:glutamate/tyrosine decarboxylase-like PLP-dependent enzyme